MANTLSGRQARDGELRTVRRGRVVLISAVIGFLLTVVWSARFVDETIGGTVADTLLGHDAAEAPIAGIAAGVVFAFVTGMAGTFTACNIAVFGALAPLVGDGAGRRERFRAALRPLGLLAAGMIPVSALYGALVGIVGTSMPQFSTAANVSGGLSPRSIQSMVVFGIVGLAMLYLGLAALRLVPDPFERRPGARMVFMGALIGGFLIGRPFGLFRAMFRDAAESGNPLYGAAAFTLQSIGNIVLLAVLLVVTAVVFGGRVHRWLAAKPHRIAVLTASALIVAGVFTFLYWDVRLLARREIIPWYPVAPWT
ncbi:hypothetical protein ACBI99_07395 [Nonomuraea sp. ATR24]|uniref:hypothetical protein n=1 Tax=Nonomuraea TaxID=83681 RepID=UPI001C5F7B2D|nr:hypothetical protein [Nonomuraea ceibae]